MVVGPVCRAGILSEIVADQIVLGIIDCESRIRIFEILPPTVVCRFTVSPNGVVWPVSVLHLAVGSTIDCLRRKLDLIVLIAVYGNIGPIEETLHDRGTILHLECRLDIGFAWEHCKAYSPFEPLAKLGFSYPDSLASILILGDFISCVEGGRCTVVVRNAGLMTCWR